MFVLNVFALVWAMATWITDFLLKCTPVDYLLALVFILNTEPLSVERMRQIGIETLDYANVLIVNHAAILYASPKSMSIHYSDYSPSLTPTTQPHDKPIFIALIWECDAGLI